MTKYRNLITFLYLGDVGLNVFMELLKADYVLYFHMSKINFMARERFSKLVKFDTAHNILSFAEA